MVPGCQAGHMVALGSTIGPDVRGLVRPQYVSRRFRAIPVPYPPLRTSVEIRLKGYRSAMESGEIRSGIADGLVCAAGAKYFVAQAMHHDNFFNYDSKIHRFNSVNMGPKKDIVALWKAAASRRGLPFGLTEHLGATFSWYKFNKGQDKEGLMRASLMTETIPSTRICICPTASIMTRTKRKRNRSHGIQPILGGISAGSTSSRKSSTCISRICCTPTAGCLSPAHGLEPAVFMPDRRSVNPSREPTVP